MGLQLVQPPGIEPIALADAKNQCRVDSDITQDDSLITLIISAARRYAEKETQCSFITQKWALVLDSFPGGVTPGYAQPGDIYSHPPNTALLHRGPVQSVDSIVYVDMSGTTQTVTAPAAPDYAIDLTGPLARISPGFGKIWPIPLPQIGAARFNYTCGFGSAATNVPESVRIWMLGAIETMYRNRGLLIQLQRGERVDAFEFINGLLDDVRVVTA